MTTTWVPSDLDAFLKPVLLKDLRVQLRARGLSPAGCRDSLADRLKEAMVATGDYTFKTADGQTDVAMTDQAISVCEGKREASVVNNYHRPEGQNVGNFLTNRNSSRVLAPPGGGSQVSLAFNATPTPAAPQRVQAPVQTPVQTPVPVQQPVQTPVPVQQPVQTPVPVQQPVQTPVQTPVPFQQPVPTPVQMPVQNPVPVQNAAPQGKPELQAAHSNNYARPGGLQNVGNFLTDRSSSRVLAPPGGTSSVSLG